VRRSWSYYPTITIHPRKHGVPAFLPRSDAGRMGSRHAFATLTCMTPCRPHTSAALLLCAGAAGHVRRHLQHASAAPEIPRPQNHATLANIFSSIGVGPILVFPCRRSCFKTLPRHLLNAGMVQSAVIGHIQRRITVRNLAPQTTTGQLSHPLPPKETLRVRQGKSYRRRSACVTLGLRGIA
jgi:hypothetical protein